MIDTTKDIFWLVAACSLGFFTFFVCWGLYYFIKIFQDAEKMVSSIKQKIDLIDNILKLAKEKLEHTSGHLTAISDNIFKIVSYFIERQGEKKGKKK